MKTRYLSKIKKGDFMFINECEHFETMLTDAYQYLRRGYTVKIEEFNRNDTDWNISEESRNQKNSYLIKCERGEVVLTFEFVEFSTIELFTKEFLDKGFVITIRR